MKRILMLLPVFLAGCASYKLGNHYRSFPGGYDRVAIPVFNNKTAEVGLESYFTAALRSEFERSRLANLTSKNDAQVIIEGTVSSASFDPTPTSANIATPNTNPADPNDSNPLPKNTVLTNEYATSIEVKIVARKVSDSSVLWEGSFSGSRNFQGALLGSPDVSSSGPIYNASARQNTAQKIAKDMMSEAHDRMTENF